MATAAELRLSFALSSPEAEPTGLRLQQRMSAAEDRFKVAAAAAAGEASSSSSFSSTSSTSSEQGSSWAAPPSPSKEQLQSRGRTGSVMMRVGLMESLSHDLEEDALRLWESVGIKALKFSRRGKPKLRKFKLEGSLLLRRSRLRRLLAGRSGSGSGSSSGGAGEGEIPATTKKKKTSDFERRTTVDLLRCFEIRRGFTTPEFQRVVGRQRGSNKYGELSHVAMSLLFVKDGEVRSLNLAFANHKAQFDDLFSAIDNRVKRLRGPFATAIIKWVRRFLVQQRCVRAGAAATSLQRFARGRRGRRRLAAALQGTTVLQAAARRRRHELVFRRFRLGGVVPLQSLSRGRRGIHYTNHRPFSTNAAPHHNFSLYSSSSFSIVTPSCTNHTPLPRPPLPSKAGPAQRKHGACATTMSIAAAPLQPWRCRATPAAPPPPPASAAPAPPPSSSRATRGRPWPRGAAPTSCVGYDKKNCDSSIVTVYACFLLLSGLHDVSCHSSWHWHVCCFYHLCAYS